MNILNSPKNKLSLLRWGGISALLCVLILVILDIMYLMRGELGTAFSPMFSVFVCLYVVVLLAGRDYIIKDNYALAQIGGAFGFLLIFVLFAEIAAFGANQMILRADNYNDQIELLSPMMALFTSTHVLAIWFHGLWMTFWGFAFFGLSGRKKITGGLMLTFAAFYIIYYVLIRVGNSELADIVHFAGHVPLFISHWLLGIVLLESSKKGRNDELTRNE